MITENRFFIWEENDLIDQKRNLSQNVENVSCGITTETKNDSIKNDSKDITETKISGIYKIINKINGKYYVGSSNDIHNRWIYHKSTLNRNIHRNSHLQKSWNKYGSSAFDFFIIQKISFNELTLEEQKYLDIAKKDGKYKCYNQSFLANRIEMTDDVKKKLSNIKKGTHASIETRLKMSLSRQKRTDKPMLGKSHTKETKLKISKGKSNIIYSFVNIKTNENFIGTCYEFRNKYNLNPSSVCALIKGRMKICFNWKLMS